ncbi:MAG: hypothetical protein R2939_17240 [Kofleriaceae bacterium]
MRVPSRSGRSVWATRIDPAQAARLDGARVQHLGAERAEALGLAVGDPAQEPRVGHDPRVGGEHPGHVGPDLEGGRVDGGRQVRRGRVGAAAAEQHGVAVGVARDEALGDDDVGGDPVEASPISGRTAAAQRADR